MHKSSLVAGLVYSYIYFHWIDDFGFIDHTVNIYSRDNFIRSIYSQDNFTIYL